MDDERTGRVQVQSSRFFCCTKIKVSYFSQTKKRQHINLRRCELASIFVAQSILGVPMPLPGAFAGYFCKELSSHEEAFFRRSDQCWAFVVVPFKFPFFFFN